MICTPALTFSKTNKQSPIHFPCIEADPCFVFGTHTALTEAGTSTRSIPATVPCSAPGQARHQHEHEQQRRVLRRCMPAQRIKHQRRAAHRAARQHPHLQGRKRLSRFFIFVSMTDGTKVVIKKPTHTRQTPCSYYTGSVSMQDRPGRVSQG